MKILKSTLLAALLGSASANSLPEPDVTDCEKDVSKCTYAICTSQGKTSSDTKNCDAAYCKKNPSHI